MMQDSKGFMWMGTINGLNRYNGKEFIVMQPQTGTSVSLADNRIRSMMEDQHGYIWIRTTSNIFCCYDSRLETFIDYDPSNPVKKFSNVHIFSNGDVWLWGNNGCCRVEHENENLKARYFDQTDLKTQTVRFVFEDQAGQIWLGADNGLYRMDNGLFQLVKPGFDFYGAEETSQYLVFATNNNKVVVYDKRKSNFLPAVSYPAGPSLLMNGIRALDNRSILLATKSGIYLFDTERMVVEPADRMFGNQRLDNANFLIDNRDNLWIYNKSGNLWRYHEGRFTEIRMIPPDILSSIDLERFEVYHDSRNIIWITTYGNGLFALDQNNQSTYHYTTSNNELPTNFLLCITEDKSGEIWVGTEFSGISKISLTNYPIRVFCPTPDESGNRNNAVRLIFEDSDNRFWMGTRNGYLYVCDSTYHILNIYTVADGLPFTMAEDTSGNKWLGTKGKGVMIFPKSGKGEPRNYLLKDQGRQTSSSNNVYTIIRDSKGRMWISSFGGGLHLAERKNGELTFRQIPSQSNNQDMMRAMIQDRSGLIWVGTNEGVNAFYPDELIGDEKKYINFTFDIRNDRSINSNEIKAIFEDSKGDIWFGTTGGGLNLLVREEPLENSWFKHYTAKNGISNEVIQAILEDEQGYIWVSTESGLSRFDRKKERFENFSFSDKRQSNLFNETSCWRKKNGELMFGSYRGVYIFDPSKISYDTYAPRIVITGLRINGNNIRPETEGSPLSESVSTTRRIKLRYNQNSFNIEFAMLNFHDPGFNQYTYFLEGYEKNWNPVTRYNVAAYRNVPAGEYRFKVKGSNSFGIWNDDETIIEITVVPPFWKSGWAVLFYVAAILAIILLASRVVVKMQRLNMAVSVEKQLTEYKLRFFTNISHEFRTPLTIIRGAIENLAGQDNLPSSVSKQVRILAKSSTRLLRLIDQLLEFRRLQNNRMELKLEKTEAVGFFNDIYQTFKELAEKKHIEFLFESNAPEWNMLLDKGKMDKICYNLLSNAFKYTPDGGKIIMKLNFSVPDDLFTLSISDSGIGIPKEKQSALFIRFNQINYSSGGTGVGLNLTSELAMVHKGSVRYNDSELGGACFSASIPLSDKNYDRDDIMLPQQQEKRSETINIPPVTEDLSDIPRNQPYKNYKLLVIEDDEEIREFIQSQLGEFFTIDASVNGAEGLEKASSEQPDLVLCDVMMPEMDGFEVTKRLKSNFQTSHIPIIMITAHSSDEHQLEGIQAGADAYIIKPFSMKYLMTRIIKLIEQREKLQQKFAQEPGLVRPSISASDKDKEFLDKLHDIIEKNMGNAELLVDDFAQALGMGRTVFYKKTKGITGHSPNEYLRIIRMKKAAELLTGTNLNVSEVSYKVGINDPFYFSKCFKSQFGKSPSQYQKNAAS